MGTAQSILCFVFWCSTAGVVYTYLGYPLVIWIFSRLMGTPNSVSKIADQKLPRVALLIAAHNEASVIEQRIQNALQLDYPPERLEIVVASDGSEDATAEICRRYENRLRLLEFPLRRGKSATLNAAVEKIDAEIIVFSDANTFMDVASVRSLVRWFAQEDVGAVCGRLMLTDPQTGGNVDSIYWRYETFLKRCEARLGGLLGANGAIYALRRNLFFPLPSETLVDDFVLPLLAKMHTGCRIAYDAGALAFEQSAPDIASEYRRRMRIGTGGFQAMATLWPLLLPGAGWTAFTFWSHKVLRWLCPLFMFAAFLTCSLLVRRPFYREMLCCQVVFYLLCGVGALRGASRLLRVFTMFAGMNLALLLGFLRWVGGEQNGTWARTQRS